jgi:hypothetical protein
VFLHVVMFKTTLTAKQSQQQARVVWQLLTVNDGLSHSTR